MTIEPTLLPTSATVDEYYAAGFWKKHTLYSIAHAHAAKTPNSVAVRDSLRALSWKELIVVIDLFSADLLRNGLLPGDTIFVGAPNRIETVVALLAASRCGLVCCPSPHRNHTVREIAALCVRGACAAYIHEPGHGADAQGDEILDIISDLPQLRVVYRLKKGESGAPFEGLIESDAGELPLPIEDPDTVTYLAFTSGSTGDPKGVMHSDNTQLVAARGIAEAWAFDKNTITCSLSPFSHNLGCGTLWTSFVAGGEFVIHDWPRRQSLLERIEAARVNYLVGVPTHAMDLVGELSSRGINKYERLKCFRVSAAACPEHVAAALFDKGIPVQKGYGMTETNGHQHGLPGDEREQVLRSSGVCCPGYNLAVFDEGNVDKRLQPGELGVVGGKGASLMLGYFDDVAASEASLNSDGWFLTGDLGMIDAKGYLCLTGRKKELIVRGGHNINPNFIEDLALRHVAVRLAAAVPVADDRLGERVCLAVMFEEETTVEPHEMLSHLAAEGLSRYDMPEFWLSLTSIPLMPNGKMEKQEIIKRLTEGNLVPEFLD